ncbi:ABC transporter ATP-binding protein [Ornithinicoccus halotolerans]|uniref:ABC transporter ATP-binding protein n=1 Tax=Ornithinicoccus halotolerans TaxID=1748220 RepID=UPI001295BF87|nr:ATP-binding cassette domain-containing protein [Ornithinicoccus halotolerans]
MLFVEGLTRRFGSTTALESVSFDVPAGRMVGFVGANGAGKTTAMRIIMGVLAADAGTVRWGSQPVTDAHRRRFGYMPEERGLYPKQGVRDQLVHLARLHGVPASVARARVTEQLERFGLGERARDRLESLSLGNQQRVQIIAAVLAEPVALVLDEPFSGLDPTAVDEMTQLLREHTAAGVPVLFSSHQLELVERLCDGLVVLRAGQVVAQGSAEELRADTPLRYRLTLRGDAGWVRDVPGVTVLDLAGRSVLVQLADQGTASRLVGLATQRDEVYEFSRQVPSLAEIYRDVVLSRSAA